MLEAIVAALLPHLIEIIVALASVYVLPQIYSVLKIKADDSRREYLENALFNGLRLAAKKLTNEVVTKDDFLAIKDDITNFAFTYAKDGVPDALAKLGVTDEHLINMIEARWEDALSDVIAAYAAAKPAPKPKAAPAA